MSSGYYLDQPGPININPANKGKFTAWAKSHGFRDVQAAAKHVLANRDKYSAEVVKMANFARNATKFNRGGKSSKKAKPNRTWQGGGQWSADDAEEATEGDTQTNDDEGAE